jgi:hypothetical protein
MLYIENRLFIEMRDCDCCLWMLEFWCNYWYLLDDRLLHAKQQLELFGREINS